LSERILFEEGDVKTHSKQELEEKVKTVLEKEAKRISFVYEKLACYYWKRSRMEEDGETERKRDRERKRENTKARMCVCWCVLKFVCWCVCV